MKELLTRRLGPAPVWGWALVGIIALAILLRWRANKNSASAGNVNDATNLTDQPGLLIPYTSDVFVNVQQPGAPGATGATGPAGPAGPPGPTGPMGPPAANNPPPRTTSITYKVVSGDVLERIAKKYGVSTSALYNANKSTIEATARQHGFSSSGNGHWIFPGEKLVIPK